MKKFLRFCEMKLFSHQIKTSVFVGESLSIFHHYFFICFHFFTADFHYIFWLFSLLITFFHVTNFLYHDCFFCCFFIRYFILCCCTMSATNLGEVFPLSGIFYLTLLPHICHSNASATDLRELSLPSDIFTLQSLRHLAHPAFIKVGNSFSLKVAGPPTEVPNTDSVHLFV